MLQSIVDLCRELTGLARDLLQVFRRRTTGTEARPARARVFGGVVFLVIPLLLVAAAGFAYGLGKQPAEIFGEQGQGVDVAGFCRSYGFPGNTLNSCSSQVDLNAACNWQHGRSDLRVHFDPQAGSYPGRAAWSALCFDPAGNSVDRDGISDMRGFCAKEFPSSSQVRAVVLDDQGEESESGGSWVCQSKIDMDLACAWQYQNRDIDAREEDGRWSCYQ
ncbi:hypothetical protein [Pseudonocardia spirodelae]|uniref:Uncharacterized protein n=1 Tax=Pseudonocardia spirodelae TaxID=3133431 RepID=A0ABU8T0H4_9PSEU